MPPERLTIRHHCHISKLRLLMLCGLLCAGCQSSRVANSTLPSQHSVRSEQLLVLSNFRLPRKHQLIENLVTLREEVTRTLNLPPPKQDVVVYLFESEAEYRAYLNRVYPGLPARRAYFVGTSKELAVFTFWGDRILEDLRHEYTHGILHASLRQVPLWLDEGLAEYFEVDDRTNSTLNLDHSVRLAKRLQNGWHPDMQRLERLDEFAQMKRSDYQESWAWVHYMLHSSPDSKAALLDYLYDLRTESNPTRLSQRLQEATPNTQERFVSHLGTFAIASRN